MFRDQATTGVSEILGTRRYRNERGLFHVEYNDIGTFDLELQVRPDANAPWATHLALTERDMKRVLNNYAEAIQHYPQVRAEVTAITGGSTVTVWYIE